MKFALSNATLLLLLSHCGSNSVCRFLLSFFRKFFFSDAGDDSATIEFGIAGKISSVSASDSSATFSKM